MQTLRFNSLSIKVGGGGLSNACDAPLALTLLMWFHVRVARMGIEQKQESGVSIACGL
jgi:hypothetical protein